MTWAEYSAAVGGTAEGMADGAAVTLYFTEQSGVAWYIGFQMAGAYGYLTGSYPTRDAALAQIHNITAAA